MKKLIFPILFSFSVFTIFAQTPKETATIHFQIFDAISQTNMPGKVVILKEGEPYLHNLSSSGMLACRDNTIYSGNGQGTFQIAAGSYEFWFGRGMEYSADKQTLKIEAGRTYQLKASLTREINTDGWVSGDMHLHTFTYSGHGDATVRERLISCVAEGLEWAVATDHNYVLDYEPWMDTLNLNQWMATTVGNEVSTKIGHFNTYPLPTGSEPINHKVTVGETLFQAIRTAAGDEVVIQINHPRWIATDFFNVKGLDPYFGFSKHPEWSNDFDAIEVLNENTQLGWIISPENKFSVKEDWFNLLNHGHRVCGLGNSDSHSVTEAIAAVPRNYIPSSTDDPSKIDEKELIQHIKAQKLSVATGLFVNLTANEKEGIGSTISTQGKPVVLNLSIQAPSWVTCDRAVLIRNGIIEQKFHIYNNNNTIRLDTSLQITPHKDSWYALIAYGDEPMTPLAQVNKAPIYPIGFTNPIWIDADGDGAITSIFDYSKKMLDAVNTNSIAVLSLLQMEPEIVPYVFYHLFENNAPNALEVTGLFLGQANTTQKLMLFRELAKSQDPLAAEILEQQREKKLLPLEEIALNWYLHFPLHQSRLDHFKQKKDTLLEEQLSYLETEFQYLFSGAKVQKFQIAAARWDEQNPVWTEVIIPNNGILEPGKLLPARPHGHFWIKTEVFARKAFELPAYFRSNAYYYAKKNGQEIVCIPNEKMEIEQKIMTFPLKKGKNELLFKLNATPNAQFSFMPINNSGLLDSNLEELIEIEHLGKDKSIWYMTKYSPKYHGFDIALTDGYRGTINHNSQLWQGWESQDVEVVVDLGKTQKVKSISAGFLTNQKSWIFYPKQVQFLVSKDGEQFEKVFSENIESDKRRPDAVIKEITSKISTKKIRYIKMLAQNIRYLPDWHQSAGSEGAWIFVDEIVVK